MPQKPEYRVRYGSKPESTYGGRTNYCIYAQQNHWSKYFPNISLSNIHNFSQAFPFVRSFVVATSISTICSAWLRYLCYFMNAIEYINSNPRHWQQTHTVEATYTYSIFDEIGLILFYSHNINLLEYNLFRKVPGAYTCYLNYLITYS